MAPYNIPPYTISISNKSGAKASYAIFAEAPQIKPVANPALAVFTGIISAAHGVATGNGEASFLLSKNLFATCGTYDVEFDHELDGDKSPICTGTEVVDQRPVTLGTKDSSGALHPGTLFEVDASEGCPVFSSNDPEMKADLDCFAIRTLNDFTISEAKMNKFVLGFSSSLRHSVGPYGNFVPAPGQTYQVKPSKVFYAVIGKFNPRDLIKLESLQGQSSTCKIDFGTLGTDTVQLTHDEHNSLHITVLADH